MGFPTPLPVSRAILKFGRDLSLARRRRRLSQASFAERMGASLATLKRLENGDPRVAFEIVARALPEDVGGAVNAGVIQSHSSVCVGRVAKLARQRYRPRRVGKARDSARTRETSR